MESTTGREPWDYENLAMEEFETSSGKKLPPSPPRINLQKNIETKAHEVVRQDSTDHSSVQEDNYD